MSDDGQKTVTASAISYKKRAKGPEQLRPNEVSEKPHDSASVQSTPSTPDTPSFNSAAGPTTRKISSRRKALQDYYKLQAQGAGEDDDGVGKEEGTEGERGGDRMGGGSGNVVGGDGEGEGENAGLGIMEEKDGVEELAKSLANEDTFGDSFKKASLQTLLRVRNRANGRLNHHDSEKKSIIYDNYSDLIKLNDVLNDINQDHRPADAFGSASDSVSNQDVDKYLNDLAGFLESQAAVFNQDFGSVVNALCEDTDGAESIASMKALRG